MDETAPDFDRNRIWLPLLLRVPVYLFIMLTMYVFSIGPMYWRWYESYAMYDSHEEALYAGNAIALFYLPLMTACENSKPFSEYINWYLDFWV